MKRSIDQISGGTSPFREVPGDRPPQPAPAGMPAVFSRLPTALWRQTLAPIITSAKAIGPLRLVSQDWNREMSEWLTGPCPPLSPFAASARHFQRNCNDLAKLQSTIAVTGILGLYEENDTKSLGYPQQRQLAATPGWNRLYSCFSTSPALVDHLLLLESQPNEIKLNVDKLEDGWHLSRLLQLMTTATWGIEVRICASDVILEPKVVEQLADFILCKEWKGRFSIELRCPDLLKRLAHDPALASWEVELGTSPGDSNDWDKLPSFRLDLTHASGKHFLCWNEDAVNWDSLMSVGMSKRIQGLTADWMTRDTLRQHVKALTARPSLLSLEMRFNRGCFLADVQEDLETLLLHSNRLTRLSLRNIASGEQQGRTQKLVGAIARCSQLETCVLDFSVVSGGAHLITLSDLPAALPRLKKLEVRLASVPTVQEVACMIAACRKHTSMQKFDLHLFEDWDLQILAPDYQVLFANLATEFAKGDTCVDINAEYGRITVSYLRTSPTNQ
jgi:hypothetical protein